MKVSTDRQKPLVKRINEEKREVKKIKEYQRKKGEVLHEILNTSSKLYY